MSSTSGLKDDLEARQKERWRWAAKHVVPWGKLETHDYDFRSWAKKESKECLDAGCLYEYARESHKFRCLLVLWDPGRKRERSETRPMIKFEGSSAWHMHLLESGWESWLRHFADPLVGNKSFDEVLQTSPSKVKESLAALASYSLYPKAVERPGRHINYPGSQIVQIQFFWLHHTDDDIGEEMKKLAKELRPAKWKEPQRRGRGKVSSTESLLDALSAMRLASHYPKSLRSGCIRPGRRKGQRETDTATDIFDDIRLGKIHGMLTHSDLEEYAARARRQFARWFPFGEPAANSITWAKRQHRKQ